MSLNQQDVAVKANGPNASRKRPAGVTVLGCLFAFGTLASGLSVLALLSVERATFPNMEDQPTRP